MSNSDKYRYAMETLGGRAFDFSALDKCQGVLNIVDAANALGKTCRFGGHCNRFYSVAEHSVLVAELGADQSAELQLMLLLHDVAEAYMGDVPRPRRLLIPDYNEAEAVVRAAVYDEYMRRQPTDDEQAIIQDLDDKMLVEEARRMLVFGPVWQHWHDAPRAGVELKYWNDTEATRAFLAKFEQLVWIQES
jgi:5'-deoxynucleotidase YfbR-like HD superfamily hydrolase